MFVADLGDHRCHAGVVTLKAVLRPREAVAHQDFAGYTWPIGRIALAEDLARLVDVHLAPGVGLGAGLDAVARVETVAGLLDGSDHGREGRVVVTGLDDQVLTVVVHEELLDGLGQRRGRNDGEGGDEKGLEHGNAPCGGWRRRKTHRTPYDSTKRAISQY